MKPSRDRKLTEKGLALLERNLHSKCSSTFRSANSVANKLTPYLRNDDVENYDLVKTYYRALKSALSNVVSAHDEFHHKFANDLDILQRFDEWCSPRFDVLQKCLTLTKEWLHRVKSENAFREVSLMICTIFIFERKNTKPMRTVIDNSHQ